ncbi:hypothetical protein LO772_04285 [Yinghuangia sp. ASG 101]|uniref:hypothetical protein n=1 Tax=Yinghuangia sp. ASG 101 TaxID=2896848 RepID=UPI001E6059A4|nr:hypothetical protein [Yinghuangia sp. ASG 101]UGQ12848.1 hypothetical protein LO772_04285 [Yinghuangia sp. ASG 101]
MGDQRATTPAEGSYCAADRAAHGASAADAGEAAGPPFADCVYCGRPTEYPAARRGVTLCAVCEWQDAQRGACSG